METQARLPMTISTKMKAVDTGWALYNELY